MWCDSSPARRRRGLDDEARNAPEPRPSVIPLPSRLREANARRAKTEGGREVGRVVASGGKEASRPQEEGGMEGANRGRETGDERGRTEGGRRAKIEGGRE